MNTDMLKSNLTILIMVMAGFCLVTGAAVFLVSFEMYNTVMQAEKPAVVEEPEPEPEPTGHSVYIEAGHGRGDDGVWDPGCSYTSGGK